MIEQLANMSEIIGTILVVVSFLFLILQIRQNTQTLRTGTMSQLSYTLIESLMSLARDSELADIYFRGLNGINDLSETEQKRFTLQISSMLRIFNEQYFHYHEGSIDQSMWKSLTGPVEDLMQYRGAQEVWKLRQHHYSEEFQKYIDDAVNTSTSKAKPLYPV